MCKCDSKIPVDSGTHSPSAVYTSMNKVSDAGKDVFRIVWMYQSHPVRGSIIYKSKELMTQWC